jgi:lipoyl(octanoyl) transferase
MAHPDRHIVVCHLGRMAYEPAWNLQKQIQARLIEAKRSEPPEALPHVMLFVEHPPVYTLGKSGDASNMLLSDAALAARGASLHHIDRGGDITFHGPGQLVGYPLLDLDRFFNDVHRYLRELEEAVIRTCAEYGVTAGRVPGRTGVWVLPEGPGQERKICAIGIRCSRWVTLHGFAFNLNTDLSYFGQIIPCGITDRGVTSLAAELGRPVDEADVCSRVQHHIAACLEASARTLHGEAAWAFLEDYLKGCLLPNFSGG